MKKPLEEKVIVLTIHTLEFSINNNITEIHVLHIHIKEIEYGKEKIYIGFVDCLFN